MRSKVISIANQKGGVGKTTTAVNLAACIAKCGKQVLLVDIDPQGNATSGVGVDKEQVEYSVYDMIIGKCSAMESIVYSEVDNLHVIPSSVDLSGAEIDLIGMDNREYILKDNFKEIRDKYDYIILDCPPSLNLLTVNAMTASDSIIVPIQCEYYALEGLSQLLHTIELINERLNPDLKIEGVVFTMFDARTNLSEQVVDNVKENLEVHIYDTVIPRNIRLAEAPSYGMPICEYDPKSTGAERYMALAKEVIS